jgi:hypothetical protein
MSQVQLSIIFVVTATAWHQALGLGTRAGRRCPSLQMAPPEPHAGQQGQRQ